MRTLLRILLYFTAAILIAGSTSYLLSGGPHEIVNHVHIKKTSDEVFTFISDMRNELKWNPDVMYMNKETSGDIGLGTTFRAKWHMSDTILVTISKFEKPKHVIFVNGGPIEVTLNVTLNPAGPETDMEALFIATPHGFMRVIFPIFKMQIEKQERLNMVNLKTALEKPGGA